MREVCVRELCLCELCVSKLCVYEFRVSKLCVSKLLVSMWGGGREGAAGVHNQKQEPHTKMWGTIQLPLHYLSGFNKYT